MSKIVGYGQALLRGLSFRAFSRDIWLICLSNIIGGFGEGLYFWVFPIYIKALQADYVGIGIVYSALFGASALTPLIGGILADRYDRKKILIAAWMPWVLAPLIYSFAASWQQLVPGAICWGVSMIGIPSVNAYVITSTKDRTKLASVLSFVWSSFSFSYIFAPSVGGFLATVIGMRSVLHLSVVLTAVATSVFLLLHSQHPPKKNRPEQRRAEPAGKNPLWRRMLLWSIFLALATFFTSIGRTFVPTFLAEEAGLSEFLVGLFGSVSYAGTTFIGIAVGHMSDKWRKSWVMVVCLLLFAVSMIPLFLVREVFALMLVAFVFGGSLATATLVSSLVGSIAPENQRGLWLSVPLTLSLAASFAAPYLAGYLYTLDPAYVFVVSVAAMPVLIAFALKKLKE